MELMKSIVRPKMVDESRSRARINIPGLTVTEVRGHGRQKATPRLSRPGIRVTLLPKMEIEVVVPDRLADELDGHHGRGADRREIGDGRVFVLPVERVIHPNRRSRAALKRCFGVRCLGASVLRYRSPCGHSTAP